MATKTKADPAGQRVNRRKAAIRIGNKLDVARRTIINRLRNIPVTKRVITNDSHAVFDYDLTPEQLQALRIEIQAEIDAQLETTDDVMPPDWWFLPFYEIPYRQGTLEEVRDFNQLIAAAIIAGLLTREGEKPQKIEPEAPLNSRRYQATLRSVQVQGYSSLKSVSQKAASQIFQHINSGIQAGSSRAEIVDSITERVEVSKADAKRIADTEIQWAYNRARLEAVRIAADSADLRAGVIHISALTPTTREHHAARHGNAYTVEDQQAWWLKDANLINCFIPGTRVQGRFCAGSKAFYRGKVIKFMTNDGRNITVTPNHKIMTQRGLVSAAEITESDYLIAHSGDVENSVGVRALNNHDADPTIEDVFGTLANFGTAFDAGVGTEDFNGDGRFINENINVVTSNRVLSYAIDTGIFKVLDDFALKHSNFSTTKGRPFFKGFNGVFLAASGFLRSFGVGLSLFRGAIFGTSYGPITSVTGFESDNFEPSVNGRSADAGFVSDLLNGFAGKVLLDKVVDVNVLEFCGHVYDLQEESGLMIANGLIASNCKCTTRSALIDADGNVVEREPR